MDENGVILRELRFENTVEGVQNLVNLAKFVDPHVKAVVERSANYRSRSTMSWKRKVSK